MAPVRIATTRVPPERGTGRTRAADGRERLHAPCDSGPAVRRGCNFGDELVYFGAGKPWSGFEQRGEPRRPRDARTSRRGRSRAAACGHPERPSVPARASRRAGLGRQGPLPAGGSGADACAQTSAIRKVPCFSVRTLEDA